MQTDMQSATAKRLRMERLRRSLTQERLAELSGVSPRTIQRIERGEETSSETILLIAKALKIPAEQLRQEATRTSFVAPWGMLVKIVSAVFVGLGPLIGYWTKMPYITVVYSVGLVLLLFYGVYGYSIKDGYLLIHRLGWATRRDLCGLTRTEIMPEAMMGSMRMFGNGGIFGITGFYRNSLIGRYRAFATDPKKSVLLEFGKKRLVVTPDNPEAFEQAVLDVIRGSEAFEQTVINILRAPSAKGQEV